MTERKVVRPVALAVGAALAGSFAVSGVANADTGASPFSMTTLSAGYMLGAGEGACGGDKGAKNAEGTCGGDKSGEGKCGEGKCGGDKMGAHVHSGDVGPEGKCGEGKCGEGKCGGDKIGAHVHSGDAAAEGSCGGDKAKDAEGSCGGDKEDKAGEGKCGGSI